MKTKKTQIYKSSLGLQPGETLHEFTGSLTEAARKMFGEDDLWVWAEEIRSDSVIFSIQKEDELKFFQHRYSRGLEGFEFDEGQEVERMWYWMPKRED